MKKQISPVEILFVVLGASLSIAAFYGLRYQLSPVLTDSEAWWFVPAIMLLMIALLSLTFWRKLYQGHQARAAGKSAPAIEALSQAPQASRLLVFLALISVPLVYVTVILSTLVTLGISALIIIVLLEFPRIPVFILVAAFIAPLVALFAAGKAIVAMLKPPRGTQAAIALDLEKHPKIKELIQEVSGKVNAKMPDNVILHLGAVFFVTQAPLKTFDGELKGRTLALGMPMLKELSVSELKCVLAHEFAHFSGNDTLYSTMVYPVHTGIEASIHNLQASAEGASGALGGSLAIMQLPALHFLFNFSLFFAAIDRTLSRARELRADWIAASLFGSRHLGQSLEKVIGYEVLEKIEVKSLQLTNTGELFSRLKAIVNQSVEDKNQVIDQARQYRESDFDTHPSLTTRKSSVAGLPELVENDLSKLDDELAAEEAALSAWAIQYFHYPVNPAEPEGEAKSTGA